MECFKFVGLTEITQMFDIREFFTNFNKPNSPVARLLAESAPREITLSRDYSVEGCEGGFNLNTFTDAGSVAESETRGHRYTKITQIGTGGFGKVYLANDTRYKERVVLKEMDLEKIKMADIAQEIAILNRYPHHNIMNILNAQSQDNSGFFELSCKLHNFAIPRPSAG